MSHIGSTIPLGQPLSASTWIISIVSHQFSWYPCVLGMLAAPCWGTVWTYYMFCYPVGNREPVKYAFSVSFISWETHYIYYLTKKKNDLITAKIRLLKLNLATTKKDVPVVSVYFKFKFWELDSTLPSAVFNAWQNSLSSFVLSVSHVQSSQEEKHSKYSSLCIVRWKSSGGRGGKTSEWDPKPHLVLCSYGWWKEIWLYTLKNSLICHCTQLTNWEFYKVLYIVVLVTQDFNFIKSFPASGSFTMSRLSTSDGRSIGASASASVLPMNISGCVLFPDVESF